MSHTRAAILMAIASIIFACFSGDWRTAITGIYFQSVAIFICWACGVGSCKTNHQSK